MIHLAMDIDGISFFLKCYEKNFSMEDGE